MGSNQLVKRIQYYTRKVKEELVDRKHAKKHRLDRLLAYKAAIHHQAKQEGYSVE